MKKRRLIYLLIFMFFFLILYLCPISGDDWGNYLEGIQGFKHIIKQTIKMYFDWEGRIISRFLINIFTCNKIFWNIINSFSITLLVYLIVKLINPKNKIIITLLSLLIILLMNIYTFSQVITWIAGNTTYFLEIPLIILYIYFLLEDKINDKKIYSICILISLIVPMFVENMALIMILIPFILNIYKYIKERKIDKKLLILMFLSIVSTLTMFLSPGNRSRIDVENVYFNSLSIFGKIKYNIASFIYYTFTINSYSLILLSISIYYLIKNNINNKVLKPLLLIYLILPPIIMNIIYLLSNFINLSINIYNDNIFLILYYISYTIIYLYLLIKTKSIKELFFLILALSSNGVMLLSPTWGYRTSIFTYIFLSITSISIIDKYYKKNKIFEIVISTIILLSSSFYLIFYINVNRCQNDLVKDIKKQLSEDKEVIEIPYFPSFTNCNINPENDYHLAIFKEYYKIPSNKDILIIKGKWKYIIFYNK